MTSKRYTTTTASVAATTTATSTMLATGSERSHGEEATMMMKRLTGKVEVEKR